MSGTSCSAKRARAEAETLRERIEQRLAPGEAVLVSACLLGVHCRYDGSTNPATGLQQLARRYRIVPVCPEQLGGLPTPRPPAEFSGGDGRAVLEGRACLQTASGEDVTEAFLRGAREAVRLGKLAGARVAILKERSPSCGVCHVYCRGRLIEGQGVTTALLVEHGFEVIPLDPPKQRERADGTGDDEPTGTEAG